MVLVRKFSEFPAGTLDEGVGLAGGANTRGPSGGGGGGGSVTHTFPQQAPVVNRGEWLKVEVPTGLYEPGQGDSSANAEIIGLCTEADAATFTVQQAGYIESGRGIPGIIGLSPGAYFIDTATPGVMVPVDASVNGQVSRAVFLATGADSGWVLPYRGLIVGGAAPSSGGGGGTDSNIQVINQVGHGFIPGDVLRVDTVSPGGPVQYAKALGDSLANAQVVGVVCATPAPTANQFSLQECGYNIGSITTDYLLAPVVAKTTYYLSPTVPGKVTSVNPTLPGQYSRPVYICEQGTATLGVNAGWIVPQRPLNLSQTTPEIHVVPNNPSGFVKGQTVYISGDGVYGLAKADTFATSQVAGIVVEASGSQFSVQQSGWCDGVVDGTYVDTGFASSDILYLSDVNAGNLTSIVPSVVGRYNKPCYVQETLVGRIGEILPQRPIAVTAPTPIFPGNVAAAANFSATGGVIAIRSSFNVASIVRTSVGHYTVNFAVPMANVNYYFLTQAGNVDAGNWWGQGPNGAGNDPTVNSFKFVTGSGGSYVDAKWITVMVWSA